MTSIRLPDDLREELDAYRESHKFPPKRTDVIVQAIREFLDRERHPKRRGN